MFEPLSVCLEQVTWALVKLRGKIHGPHHPSLHRSHSLDWVRDVGVRACQLVQLWHWSPCAFPLHILVLRLMSCWSSCQSKQKLVYVPILVPPGCTEKGIILKFYYKLQILMKFKWLNYAQTLWISSSTLVCSPHTSKDAFTNLYEHITGWDEFLHPSTSGPRPVFWDWKYRTSCKQFIKQSKDHVTKTKLQLSKG